MLSWGAIFRLGVVQTCIGAIIVLMTSTLNRIIVVELALPAIVPGLLLGGIISTCDRLLGDLKQGKFPPVSGSPGKTFARFGAAEWDERRTAFRDQVKAAAE